MFRQSRHDSLNDFFVVETEGPDGLFYHGTVVDADENDILLVDHHLPNVPPIMTLCSLAFKCDPRDFLTSTTDTLDAVDAFIITQLCEDMPWVWYPGRLLAVNWPAFAVVKTEIFGEQKMRVVPCDHVRLANHPRIPVIQCFTYVKASFLLPQSTLFRQTEEFMKLWNNYFDKERSKQGKAVAVADGQVICLGSQYWIDKVKARIACNDKYGGRLLETLMVDAETNVWRQKQVPLDQATSLMMDTTPECKSLTEYPPDRNIINTLPDAVLGKIFAFVDVCEQSRIRRVCRLWSRLLPLCTTLNPQSLAFCVNGPRFPGDTDRILKFASCLCQYYSEQVNDIVLLGNASDGGAFNDFIQVLVTMQGVLKRPPLRRLIVSTVDLSNNTTSNGVLVNSLLLAAHPCSHLGCEEFIIDCG
ncbi:uncharacterized protein LOC129587564 [Paramacrobiotus metropolitanus]|uniref:uncharacterized protein LOC129587564 n=1 Tax=Paramacrobiotus metropolitanus TaxID=2943436 RepID=UPI0024460A51|nr:uncharacterized protein LOC129587564 [Paramacrobiotus metropolitanus]